MTPFFRAIALLSAAASTAAASNITVPHLTGVFLALSDETAVWTAAEWAEDLQAMADVGIEFFCIRGLAQGIHGPTPDCPLGRFRTYWPTKAPGLLANNCSAPVSPDAPDTVGRVLAEAAKLGLRVHLGGAFLADGPSAFHPGVLPNSTAFFQKYAWLQWEIYQDLWAQYGPANLAGFYTSLEESNDRRWLDVSSDLAGHFLEPLARDIKTKLPAVPPSFKVWASPSYEGNLTRDPAVDHMDPAIMGAFWNQVFQWAPHFDLVAPQDAMGAQGNSFANVTASLSAIVSGSRAAGRSVWANVELFEVWPPSCHWPTTCDGRHPAPIERIVAQLANEAHLVDEVISWEWHSCLSPHGSTKATAVLYDAYKKYVLNR